MFKLKGNRNSIFDVLGIYVRAPPRAFRCVRGLTRKGVLNTVQYLYYKCESRHYSAEKKKHPLFQAFDS